MAGKIYPGIGLILLFIAWCVHNLPLIIIGGAFLLAGILSLWAFNTGVDYQDTRYRMYKKVCFVKTGKWRAFAEVSHVLIRSYSYIHHYPYTRERYTNRPGKERVVLYQVYFVRNNGYDKLFESDIEEEAEEFAEQLRVRFAKEVQRKIDD